MVETVAQKVIRVFGGQSALATKIGKGQSTVAYWAKVGTIPSKWHVPLLQLASREGLPLSSADLISVPPNVVSDELPIARFPGTLYIGEENPISVYVLSDGRRVISRTSATAALSGNRQSGDLESYVRIEPLRPYLKVSLQEELVQFRLEGVDNKQVAGITAEVFLAICRAYVSAWNDSATFTERQTEIAKQASSFLAACAGVGLDALIDEATGYQYERAEDALRVKLAAYLSEEMRPWEKTFPDELWQEFGRLTGWTGSFQSRPKYWGKLVNELVYECLDADVAQWLKDNAPAPRHGQNYHQWLSGQYGLKKLTEHLYMLIGMATACRDMDELRYRMALKYGKQAVQFRLYIDPPK